MKLIVTGDERDIANSAWVSTIDEAKALMRSDEDVQRVLRFLVENHHTSPIEVVTLTFSFENSSENDDSSDENYKLIEPLLENKFCKYSTAIIDGKEHSFVTVDLLNFVKVIQYKNLFAGQLWKTFSSEKPVLSSFLNKFKDIEPSYADDVSCLLGDDHGMTVDLIQVHKNDLPEHSRATWRVKCPLSIAVQILRHRAGSYNMVSGRYRTILQDIYNVPLDVNNIYDKSNVADDAHNIYEMLNKINDQYLIMMKKLKIAKNNSIISNDEYKRARECARFALSEGRMTELYITYYLSDFYNNYEVLRNSTHAQVEHIWIAQKMRETLEN
jgi:flavin-dependent thymidylate synthase